MSTRVAVVLLLCAGVAAAEPDKLHQLKDAMARGAALMDKKDARGAMKAYQEAVAIDPLEPHALSELSWAAVVAGDFAVAKEVALRAVEYHAFDDGLLAASSYNLGRALEGLHDAAGAKAAYETSLRYRENQEVRARYVKLGGADLFEGRVLEGPFDEVDGDDDPHAVKGLGKPFAVVRLSKIEPKNPDEPWQVNLALQTAQGSWWILPHVGDQANRVHFEVQKADVAGGRLVLRWQRDAGKYSWDLVRGVIVCGVNAAGKVACVGPIATFAARNQHTGQHASGQESDAMRVAHDCTAQLLTGDVLEVVPSRPPTDTSTWDHVTPAPAKACERLAVSGKHKLGI